MQNLAALDFRGSLYTRFSHDNMLEGRNGSRVMEPGPNDYSEKCRGMVGETN